MEPICSCEKIIEKDGKKVVVCDDTRSQLLPLLRKIQDEKGYIGDVDMQKLADHLGIHPVEVYSVVTFYSFLRSEKKGRHTIRVSNCMPNVMGGSKDLIKAFEQELGIKMGETTKDGDITLEATGCIGMCDQVPAIMADEKLIGAVTSEKAKEIIKELRSKK